MIDSNKSTAEALLELLPALHRLARGRFPAGGRERPECHRRGHRSGQDLAEKRGQHRVLMVLSGRERCTMQELATALDVAPPTVTGMVKRLLSQGYVERVHDEGDWRNVWVQLTDEGREAITRSQRERVATLESRVAELSEEDQARIREAIPALERLLGLGQDVRGCSRGGR